MCVAVSGKTTLFPQMQCSATAISQDYSNFRYVGYDHTGVLIPSVHGHDNDVGNTTHIFTPVQGLQNKNARVSLS